MTQPDDNLNASISAEKRRLRIVHYIPGIRLEQGGVARAILDWCEVFANRGHEVTLVTSQPDDVPDEWMKNDPAKPRVVVIPKAWSPAKLLTCESLATIEILLRNADVLHLHAPWLNGNRQISKLADRLNVKYLVTIHGMLDVWAMSQRPLKKKLYLKLFGQRVLDGAAMIHCTAEAEAAQARRWFNNRNIAILPYIVDLKPFEVLPGPDLAMPLLPEGKREERKILFLSRLHEKKGVDILIRAAGILRDQGIPFVVMIAGNSADDYENRLRDLTKELNLEDRVFFVGLITGEQKISLYQLADIFVLPTHQENFGLVLTEALSCGTPVITTKGTDIWKEVQTAGAIIAETNPESIASAIKGLLEKPEDLPTRGARGRAWAFESLAVEPLALKYEKLYGQLADGRP